MKPTKKDFDFFKECCLEYIKKYQLNNWTFRFHFEGDGKREEQAAYVVRNRENLQADIYLDSRYSFTDREDIRQSAKHEIIHCLIGELYLLGINREMNLDEIDRAEEELVHKLEEFLP